MIPFNPHIKYYERDRRGYFTATVTPRQMRLNPRFVSTVESPAPVGDPRIVQLALRLGF